MQELQTLSFDNNYFIRYFRYIDIDRTKKLMALSNCVEYNDIYTR